MFPAITLDLIDESQSGKAATANNLWDAMSHNALFGIKSISGLVVVFYGGNMNVSGTPTAIASQSITLTASTTNYIYSTSAGVFTKTTSIPASWPGPLASSAVAMYTIVTGTASITSGTNWILGTGLPGAAGATGIQGPEGSDFAETRKHIWMTNGGGSTTPSALGFDAATLSGTAASARTLSASTLRESIPYIGYPTSVSTAGASSQVYGTRNFCYLGNAAGRGGFSLAMRFCMETSVVASPANQRSFFGLMPTGVIGNVEPDTVLSMIGVGALAGDSNFRIFHNDGSGTATKTAFATPGNFPTRLTDNVYELLITSVANSGIVSLTLSNINDGVSESATISSDLPANTTFLSWVAWVNNGSTAATASMGLMQVIGETRY